MQPQPDLELTAIVVCRNDEELVGHRIRRLRPDGEALSYEVAR